MAVRDIIVIGGSKGSTPALTRLVAGLPGELPAAVLVVVHLPPFTPSTLPTRLARSGRLIAAFAEDGEPIVRGRVYVAPSDRHLRVSRNRIRLDRGPPEHGHRPAIDALFRSAAQAYGPRVAGVVLSGLLRDGTHGLSVIHRRGGVAIVQDPRDALEPSMPRHALSEGVVDHCVPVAEMALLLVRLAHDSGERDEPRAVAYPDRDARDDLGPVMLSASMAGIVSDRDEVDGARCVALRSMLTRWRAYLSLARARLPWGRSITLHVTPREGDRPPGRASLTTQELDRRSVGNRELVTRASFHLKHLSASFGNEGHAVILADRDGWILEVRGTLRAFVGVSSGFAVGSRGPESWLGRNGVGTVLAVGEGPIVCRLSDDPRTGQAVACLAVPIRQGGEIVGALVLAVLHPGADPVRMTRLCACAETIEAGLGSRVPAGVER